MSDEQLIEAVAKLWVDNGGDVDGLLWCFSRIKAAIATESKARADARYLATLTE